MVMRGGALFILLRAIRQKPYGRISPRNEFRLLRRRISMLGRRTPGACVGSLWDRSISNPRPSFNLLGVSYQKIASALGGEAMLPGTLSGEDVKKKVHLRSSAHLVAKAFKSHNSPIGMPKSARKY
jgi:hypothetical protein